MLSDMTFSAGLHSLASPMLATGRSARIDRCRYCAMMNPWAT